jgi:hypothetical protein
LRYCALFMEPEGSYRAHKSSPLVAIWNHIAATHLSHHYALMYA